jgi:hypothetical protein
MSTLPGIMISAIIRNHFRFDIDGASAHQILGLDVQARHRYQRFEVQRTVLAEDSYEVSGVRNVESDIQQREVNPRAGSRRGKVAIDNAPFGFLAATTNGDSVPINRG